MFDSDRVLQFKGTLGTGDMRHACSLLTLLCLEELVLL